MFKKAVISDEISQDFFRAVKIICRFKLEGIELRSVWDKNPHELSSSEIANIRKTVQSEGLTIPCLDTPLFKCRLHSNHDYQEHLQILKRSMEVAHELGIGFIRGFTFWDEESEIDFFEANLPVITDKIQAITGMLEENKIVLVIESDPATSANSSQKLEKFLTNLTSPWIKAVWDPGNNLYVQGAEKPYPDAYERLKPYIAHVHIKDICRAPGGDPEACCIGAGEVGYPEVFKRLIADGYDGWVSLETHYRLRSGPLSEELLALPKGSSFSMGGEEATIESLESWEKILMDMGRLR